MQSQEFDMIVYRQIERSKEVLVDKELEYVVDVDDRLHNFRTAAKLQGTSMRQALAGMMAKHTVSVYDMIKDDINHHNKEKWNEKITDHINYLLILQAVLYEERSDAKSGEEHNNSL